MTRLNCALLEFVLILPSLALLPSLATARSIGISSVSMAGGPATCSGALCHGPAASDLVIVTISGPDSLAPGETALYTLAMTEIANGGLQVGTGMNLSLFLDNVQLLIDQTMEQDPDFPSNLQVLNGEITHNSNVNALPSPDGGVGVFSYTVPIDAPLEEGPMVIMAAMNSFNQNFTSSGDNWNRAEKVVSVPEPAGTAMLTAGGVLLTLLHRRKNRSR